MPYTMTCLNFQIMDTWTRQKGYPVLNLTRSATGDSYIAVQERFLTDPNAYANVQ